jgi:hypothetical protein
MSKKNSIDDQRTLSLEKEREAKIIMRKPYYSKKKGKIWVFVV